MTNSLTSSLATGRHKDPGDRLSLQTCILVLFATVLLTVLVAVWPKPGKSVGVLFPPWVGTAELFARVGHAGGGVVAVGNLPGIVIADSIHATFVKDLRRHGAILVFDGALTSALCSVQSP